ncbi:MULTISPECIES: HNH endonuclease [unclassified Desulfovibrio]|uniref:HNH endonuclease n=1 Tax=unclassified Desulfovibrio TaxID=2593640 RepID=UPI0013EB16C5|nr:MULTISPECIES: HNH endonuclease [unclassified Desulfovibrio]
MSTRVMAPSFSCPFAVGEVISNRTLYTAFRCACEGGVRYSSAFHVLVVVSNYVDPRHTGGAWKDGVLYYTGSGKAGDQELKKGGNRRLCECMRGGLPGYYFEVHTEGRYTYRGRLEAAGEPFQREEPGADGAGRKVWIFPLRLAGA